MFECCRLHSWPKFQFRLAPNQKCLQASFLLSFSKVPEAITSVIVGKSETTEMSVGESYLIFYILFTAPNFWAWKFYTQKCVNLRHKLHESTLFYTIWNICPFSGKPAPRQMVLRAGNTVLAHCWEEAYCYASRNNTFKHGLHHKQDLFNTLS